MARPKLDDIDNMESIAPKNNTKKQKNEKKNKKMTNKSTQKGRYILEVSNPSRQTFRLLILIPTKNLPSWCQ